MGLVLNGMDLQESKLQLYHSTLQFMEKLVKPVQGDGCWQSWVSVFGPEHPAPLKAASGLLQVLVRLWRPEPQKPLQGEPWSVVGISTIDCKEKTSMSKRRSQSIKPVFHFTRIVAKRSVILCSMSTWVELMILAQKKNATVRYDTLEVETVFTDTTLINTMKLFIQHKKKEQSNTLQSKRTSLLVHLLGQGPA